MLPPSASAAPFWAVLDGVGGWAEVGVDPAEYSRALSAALLKAAAALSAEKIEEKDLRTVLEAAWLDVRQSRIQVLLLLLLPSPSPSP